jgi:hypothetical protein
MAKMEIIGGSFRDPSGFVFVADNVVYRQVNPIYKPHYEQLMSSGLYDNLVKHGLLISHDDAPNNVTTDIESYKIICPQQLPFVSYPYEWSFSQLKDAALATLSIQKHAIKHRMILKDASAYNIQFVNGKPMFIDTLSFESYEEGQPWSAYKQFCQHFLAPLTLMSYKDVRLSQLLRVHIDGVPLDLASSLLPKRTYFNIGLVMHLHLHARAQKRYEDDTTSVKSTRKLSKQASLNIISDLQSTIKGLRWNYGQTAWANYYQGDSYQDIGFNDKQSLVSDYLDIVKPKCIWDLGANTGVFSRIASQRGIFAVSLDSDPGVVEANYLQIKHQKEKQLLPLLIDLSNPSAGIGWANRERESLAERSQADCVFALALIHHLAIRNNVPLLNLANYFASLSEWLIIEFVPKSDEKVKTLLETREDIFPNYTQEGFEKIFSQVYDIIKAQPIKQSDRVLYLLQRK